MAGEWPERTLRELTENFDGLRVPVKESDRHAGPYPYYGASGVVDYVDDYLFDGEYLLVAEDGENLRTRNTPAAFIARGKFWVNNHAHVVRGNHEADTRFLMYALTGAGISGYLTGSTMPKLTQGNLNRISIWAPPLDSQRAIAHILGTLDDKIELNRRMNETLEAIARALFKSWFVDREGRDGAEGWPRITLASAFDINPPRSVRRDHPAPYLDMANMPTRGPSARDVSFRTPGSGARFRNGDTLLARITPCLENGKTALVDFLSDDECGWGSTEYIVLRPRPPLPEEFAYCLARLPEFVAYAVARMSGSSGRQRVSASAIGEYAISLPPAEHATRFREVVRPMFEGITLLTQEARTLVALRDALLPRLISGELRLKDADQLVEAVSA